MRIFLIGTYVENQGSFENFSKYCQLLGKELGKKDIDIILCSPFVKSVDFEIIKGSSENIEISANFEIHYPNHLNVINKWNELLDTIISKEKLKIKHFHYAPPEIETNESWRYSWLFCQLQAIQKADIIISIGGKIDAAANLLLRIAEAQNKLIIPIPKFGGVAETFYEKIKYSLIDIIGVRNYDLLLNHKDLSEIVKIIFENSLKKEFFDFNGKIPIFFISYSKAKPSDADLVETILRRRNYLVLRDETDFYPSSDIPIMIKENIYKSDIFICLWSQEYACSPWCFDELSIALESKEKNNKIVWIFCLDDTRMVHPKARNLLNYRIRTREEIEGKILNLLKDFK